MGNQTFIHILDSHQPFICSVDTKFNLNIQFKEIVFAYFLPVLCLLGIKVFKSAKRTFRKLLTGEVKIRYFRDVTYTMIVSVDSK
jgi:hypothetical protein